MKRCSTEINKFNRKSIMQLENAIKNALRILLGPAGSGKTFLLIKLCNENFEISEEGFSFTRKIQYAYSDINYMIIINFSGIK